MAVAMAIALPACGIVAGRLLGLLLGGALGSGARADVFCVPAHGFKASADAAGGVLDQAEVDFGKRVSCWHKFSLMGFWLSWNVVSDKINFMKTR